MVAAALSVTDDQRQELGRVASSSVLPHRQVVQAQALLWAADGVANEEIARRCRVDSDTVRRWRNRFTDRGVDGVGKVAEGRGRKSWLPADTVQRVVELTLTGEPPGGATHWTTRSLAAEVGVGKDTVAQVWSDHQLKPWKVDVFKISNDPEFETKLVDVVGLYLKPPARAVVFSFDEKTQCQALDRTQPSLPMKPGRGGTMTHDYKRHGTIDLFAAMNVGTGEVHTHLRKGHAGADVLAFFKQIDATVAKGLSVHVILDNLSAHKAPEVGQWLAHKSRRRWHLHFIPTSSSWLNLVERWFKELTDKRLRRGVFTSVDNLTQAITVWAEHWNSDPTPFVWKATADDIIKKVSRGRETLHQIKSSTDH
jgi:transposase